MNSIVQYRGTDVQPLYEAVRPRGNRDEAGSLGEDMHALADELQTLGGDVLVAKSQTSDEVWRELATFIKGCPERPQLVEGKFRALRARQRYRGPV